MPITSAACAQSGQGDPAFETLSASETRYNRVVQSIYGTPEQRSATEELLFFKVQQAISGCMRGEGAKYAITKFSGIARFSLTAPGDLTAFAPLSDDFGVADRLAQLAADGEPTNREFSSLTDKGRDEYLRALEGCQNAGQQFQGQSMPAGHDDLANRLIDALSKVERSAEVTAALAKYPACLAERSVKAPDWSALYLSVEKSFPPTPSAPTDVTKDPQWLKAREYEQRAAAADAECRSETREIAIIAAAPVLARFERDNAAALKGIGVHWSEAEAEVITMRQSLNAGD
ncbi:hypothetical protein [Micromonospora carbonacea]|uniref:hypothetical protein n=1 Tax=Micromonospora carbonacea TaxID=47853 RepID=UPI00114D16CA|nr:hypothetical protein [Micromonospora carbonacea]